MCNTLLCSVTIQHSNPSQMFHLISNTHYLETELCDIPLLFFCWCCEYSSVLCTVMYCCKRASSFFARRPASHRICKLLILSLYQWFTFVDVYSCSYDTRTYLIRLSNTYTPFSLLPCYLYDSTRKDQFNHHRHLNWLITSSSSPFLLTRVCQFALYTAF